MSAGYGKSLKKIVLQLIHSVTPQNKILTRNTFCKRMNLNSLGAKEKQRCRQTHFENYKKDVVVRRGTETKR